MQPLKKTKNVKTSPIKKVRHLIADNLSWLHGYPMASQSGRGVTWIRVEDGETSIPLTPELLSTAAYTLKKLDYKFPKALGKVVGNREIWLNSNRNMLDQITPLLHTDHPRIESLFENPAFYPAKTVSLSRHLLEQAPGLARVLCSLSWLHAMRPQDGRESLIQLRQDRELFLTLLTEEQSRCPEEEKIRLSVLLIHLLRLEGTERPARLCTRLVDERIYTIPLNGPDEIKGYLGQLRNTVMCQPCGEIRVPQPCYGSQLRQWTRELAGREQRQRRICLRLLELVEPVQLLDRWQLWWQQVQSISRTILALAHRPQGLKRPQKELFNQLKALQRTMPPCFRGGQFLADISAIGDTLSASRFRSLTAAMELLPRDHPTAPLRIDFLHDWATLTRGGWSKKEQQASLDFIPAFAWFLRHNRLPLEKKLSLWNETKKCRQQSSSYGCDFTCDICYAELNLQQSKRLLRIINSLLDQECTLHPNYIDSLIRLLRLSRDDRKIIRLFQEFIALKIVEEYLPNRLLNTAYRICRNQPNLFSRIVAILSREEDYEDSHFGQLERINTLFHRAGFPDVIVLHLEQGHLKQVLRTSRQFIKIENAGHSLPKIPDPVLPDPLPGGLDHYPENIRQLVTRLHALTPKAEKIASRLLHKDYPAPEKLQQELVRLARKIKDYPDEVPAGLQKRLHTLRHRLSHPAGVSEKRQQLLIKKLEWACSRILFDCFAALVEEQWLTALPAFQQPGEPPPPWLIREGMDGVILGLDSLTSRQQELAHTILRRRCTDRPWDFRDHEKNQNFIRVMEQQGINMDSWLNGFSQIKDTDTDRLCLYLENDPLEIFQMGAHFKTCLSPGAFNYFSVPANIVDINKRVLYAVGKHKTIVGRCLLALADSGGIVAFHPYCHNDALDFAGMVREFVHALARKMATIPVADGKVSCLVAPSWYDDGTVDLGRSFAFLQKGSLFRKGLATSRPDRLIEQLTKQFAPMRLNDLTLGLVIELPEIRDNTSLSLTLLEYMRTSGTVSADLICSLAVHTATAETVPELYRKFGKQIILSIIRQYRSQRQLNRKGMDFLIQANPSKAIAVLHKLRTPGIRHWQDTANGTMIFFQAEAFHALGRSQAAAELYRAATKARLPDDLRQRAEQPSKQRG